MVPSQEKVLKLERIQRITTKIVPELKNLTYEEKIKEMQLTFRVRRERGDLIVIYKLVNNLETLNGLKEKLIMTTNV